ncbi:hypothetical protein JG688_00000929 [Phytophthora aleatoria]|uniref:Helicase ATP-binding domain-containing protein n=1 Tax=Phytophthora aleatoria TaxID=2496075 RepID=A0A8J5JBV5_9STRA|nr:hypothetical protein JG688_00000929 [Phytophthora aleatoria]
MDTDGGGIKKRKAEANATLRKKPRRSGRDKSEFVSMEVGMREFKKRLAASGSKDADTAAAGANTVEDLTQDVKKTRTRVKPKTEATKTAAKKATAAVKKAPVKKTVSAAKKAAIAKKSTAEKKTPVKRTTRAATGMTLAEVKAQLEREQKERVEYRIQTLRLLSEGLYDGEKGESYRPRIVRVGRPESSQQLSSLAAAREASESKKNRKKMRKYAREVEEVLLESLVTKHRSTFPTVKQARQAIIKNAQIVFCTLSGAGSVAMCEFAQDFDALIIDEAAQAVEASTLIPFKFRPHRVVLVGDHRQLSATVISKNLVSMGYDRSLQQRLVENGSPVLLLNQQYRMHPEISEFPSTYFYDGRLVQNENMREWTAQDYHRDRAFKPLLFLDVQGAQSQVSGSTSLRNLSEVEAVIQLVRRLLTKFPRIDWKKRIGVIAPYKQQIYEVRGAIGKLEAEFERHLGIEVNTVDGFQGREKEIIIYSCVRTSYGGRRKKKKRSRGNDEDGDVLDAFWADERRMNVAITRAKSSLWIVGNSTLLKQSRAWRALIQHTKDHSSVRQDPEIEELDEENGEWVLCRTCAEHYERTRRGRKPNDPKGFKVKMNGRFQEAAWVMHKSRVVAHRGTSEMGTETPEEEERRREIELELEARRILLKRRRVASSEEGAEEEIVEMENREERQVEEPSAAQLVHLPTTGWRCPGIVPDAFYRDNVELVHAFAKYYVGTYRVNVVRDLRSDKLCIENDQVNQILVKDATLMSAEELAVLSKFKHSSDMNLNLEGRKLKQAAMAAVQHFCGPAKNFSAHKGSGRAKAITARNERFDRVQQPLSMEVMLQLQSLDSSMHDGGAAAVAPEAMQSQEGSVQQPTSPNGYLIQQSAAATEVIERFPSSREE